MSYRNLDGRIRTLPTTRFPRSKFDMPVIRRLQSQKHGKLYPFFMQFVYPGDTWKIDTNIFARADISAKVPLDDIHVDTFYFFVPCRIIDHDFPKALGEKDDPYDKKIYSIPQTKLTFLDTGSSESYFPDFETLEFLPFYLNYDIFASSSESDVSDDLTSYPLAVYHKVFDDYFRDENLEAIFDFKTQLFNNTINLSLDEGDGGDYSESGLIDLGLGIKYVNRLPDLFSTGLVSPQKSPDGNAVTFSLGETAPLITGDTYKLAPNAVNPGDIVFDDIYDTVEGSVESFIASNTTKTGLYTDLSKATATSINELRLLMNLQSLYERRGMFGTRYISTLRGLWGISVPDGLLERPEYLGGATTSLNNIPVLNTASDLGQMSGNSATFFTDGGFTKSFVEYGYIIGLCCTRVKHTYSQGLDPTLWKVKDGTLDLYNPLFANLGYNGTKKYELFNDPSVADNEEVFNYQEAWARLRQVPSTATGIFNQNSGSGYAEMRQKWTYSDYYEEHPVFSKAWLNEDPSNVQRTMTGGLIPNSTGTGDDLTVYGGSHQYLFQFYTKPVVTRILPGYSIPASLIGRW